MQLLTSQSSGAGVHPWWWGGSGMLLGVDIDPLEFVCAAAAKPRAKEGAVGLMPAAAVGTWDQCRQREEHLQPAASQDHFLITLLLPFPQLKTSCLANPLPRLKVSIS